MSLSSPRLLNNNQSISPEVDYWYKLRARRNVQRAIFEAEMGHARRQTGDRHAKFKKELSARREHEARERQRIKKNNEEIRCHRKAFADAYKPPILQIKRDRVNVTEESRRPPWVSAVPIFGLLQSTKKKSLRALTSTKTSTGELSSVWDRFGGSASSSVTNSNAYATLYGFGQSRDAVLSGEFGPRRLPLEEREKAVASQKRLSTRLAEKRGLPRPITPFVVEERAKRGLSNVVVQPLSLTM
eukprot:PhM_4_TR9849/c0_g1_i1/m.53574